MASRWGWGGVALLTQSRVYNFYTQIHTDEEIKYEAVTLKIFLTVQVHIIVYSMFLLELSILGLFKVLNQLVKILMKESQIRRGKSIEIYHAAE